MMKYVLFLFIGIVLCGCKPKVTSDTPVRPDNFPEFLKAPGNAMDIRYATPENANMTEGVYTLNYFVNEDFPPKPTMDFIHSQLLAGSFFLLKYNPIDHFEVFHGWHTDTMRNPGYIEYILGEQN
jgi:hypothetical protein